MAVVQTTFDFECNGYGWSESWFKDIALTSLKAHWLASGLGLAIKRAAMLAAEAKLFAASNSFVDVKSDGYLQYLNLPGNPQFHCEDPHTTIYSAVRAQGDTLRKAVFIRGQDDNCIMDGGNFQPGNAAFQAAGTAFFDSIVNNGWGWMRNVAAPKGEVIGYTTNPLTGFVTITTSPNFFPPPPAGVDTYTPVRILFKGVKSRLNGYSVVQVIDHETCMTLKPLALFPFPKKGSITRYTKSFVAAENWNFQKSGMRRAGRPKLHTVGHQSATPRG